MAKKQWWKEAIVYQIYPRSFKDSNGDGVGDLRGIIEKLDYIRDLGVDTVWLNPVYKSPNDDGGYDISDYYTLQQEFGTLEDFDDLVDGLHSRGLKLVMDLVVNHSSDEHTWFQQSRKSKDNPYRDFYFWRPGKNGGPPNNWPSFFGGSAWEKDDVTGEYYLHLFSRKQPDLNWENPRLRREVSALMEYWLEKGVDGLRLDVISAISKRTNFPDSDTTDFNETIRKYYANGPRLKEFIREMRNSVWNHYRVMTVGEGPGITPDNALDYLDEREGLHMIFHFGHMFMDQGPGGRFDPVPWNLSDFKQVFQTWDSALRDKGWGSIFLGNHDFARMVSRWGNDKEHRAASSKLLITLMLSMRGTPYIFQGDELGMTNFTLGSVSESKDIETQNGWREASRRGMSEEEFVAIANYSGRDNARTPVQWSETKHAGFTSGEPWMKVNPNYPEINVEQQINDPNSVLAYFRQMTRLRRDNHALVYGEYIPINTREEFLFAYDRAEGEEKWRVLLNFSDNRINLPDNLIPPTAVRIIGNYPASAAGDLRPREAIIVKL